MLYDTQATVTDMREGQHFSAKGRSYDAGSKKGELLIVVHRGTGQGLIHGWQGNHVTLSRNLMYTES